MRFPAVVPRFPSAIVFAAALLLGACVNTDRTPHLVKTTPVDFKETFSDMVFKVLPAGQQVRLEFNRNDPVFSFQGGPSSYAALVLPDLPQPYVLRIDSEVVKTEIGNPGTLFFPVLTFLDAGKNWIKTFDSLPYVTQKPVSKTNYMTVSLQISDEIATARYVVIHTEGSKLNKAIGYHDGEVLMQSNNFDTMMTAPITAPRYRYEFVSEGWVRLKAFVGPEERVAPPAEY